MIELTEGTIRVGRISSQTAGTKTGNATTVNVAEEARNTPLAGNNRACSNGRNREDKCSNDAFSTNNRICLKKPICYEHKQEGGKELL